jgi:AcrR family transcriptional regulator
MSQTFDPVEQVSRTVDTKERILDAAERLFAANGFESTSLRQITAEANANLAAVNYHFQSKESLTRAVLLRRLGPINQRRTDLLDAIEFAAGDGPLELEDVMRAFILPVMEAREADVRTRCLPKIMGRVLSEPGGWPMKAFQAEMSQQVARFGAAFQRACPGAPVGEIFWGMHFGIGSMAHFLLAGELLTFLTGGQADPEDYPAATDRLVRFVCGGMRAMAVQTKEAAR